MRRERQCGRPGRPAAERRRRRRTNARPPRTNKSAARGFVTSSAAVHPKRIAAGHVFGGSARARQTSDARERGTRGGAEPAELQGREGVRAGSAAALTRSVPAGVAETTSRRARRRAMPLANGSRSDPARNLYCGCRSAPRTGRIAFVGCREQGRGSRAHAAPSGQTRPGSGAAPPPQHQQPSRNQPSRQPCLRKATRTSCPRRRRANV